MAETDWNQENNVIKIMRALEDMYKQAEERQQGSGVLPLAEQDTHKIYEFLEGSVPEKDIHLAIHHRIVFCADCDHVCGANYRECDSCRDMHFGNSRFLV